MIICLQMKKIDLNIKYLIIIKMVFYIYKIIGVNYIGSTNDIKQRVLQHKCCCFNKKSKNHNMLVYQYIREKQKNIELEILFCYKKECSFKIQRLVEQFYINKYDSVNNGLNSYNAIVNRKKHRKEYREKNKEKIKKQRKKCYEKNKKKSKEYYEKNKEKIKKRVNERAKKNKEKINKKINCPYCNCLISKQGLKRHQRTIKCDNIFWSLLEAEFNDYLSTDEEESDNNLSLVIS